MDVLQRAMEEAIAGVYGSILVQLIARKFAEKGIELSGKQKDELKAHLSSNEDLDLNPLFKSWSFPGPDDDIEIVINLTDSDIQAVEEAVRNFGTGMPEVMQSMSDELARSILKSLKRDWPGQAKHERALRRGFLNRLEKRWSAAFDLLSMFLTIATELGESINERLRKAETNQAHVVEVLTRLHARACQVTWEIITLLRNGFADGAMARWRTLHEIAAVSLFVGKHGEEVAERYLLHEAEESRYAARQYQKYADRLGYEPYAQEELEALERECEHLERRFGAAFKGDYGWAAEQLHPKKPTFSLIEEVVGIDHLRPLYRMAGHNVHANPKGVMFKLGLIAESKILLTGASNFGFADPAQNAALSLMQITSGLALLDTNLDTIVMTKLMLNLSREIGDTFVAIQKAMKNENESNEDVGQTLDIAVSSITNPLSLLGRGGVSEN